MHDTAQAARVLMGDSLGFHIIFVLMGLTLPVLVSWFELKGLLSKDAKDIAVARFWTKIMGLLVVTGVISGTIIALQMSLVWPGILKFGGQVIGLPFMFETYAFFIEATFLALYLTTWDKLSPWLHWITGVFVVIGSTLSAYAITSINGWMNSPSGFDYINGKIEHVNVWAAMFSRTAIIEFVHSMPGYYLTGGLIVASLYCVRLAWKKYSVRSAKASQLDWRIVHRLLIFAVIMFVASAITGDLTGKYLARHEPDKLAAIELVQHSTKNAPLVVGGVGREDGTIVGPHFQIPNALSIMAGDSSNYVVQGRDVTPAKERPSLVLHTFFDIKMTLLDILAALVVGYFALYYLRRDWLKKQWVLLLLGCSGLASLGMVEFGWMITEIGRQPWAVRGYVTTDQALTSSHGVSVFGFLFPLAYVALFIVTVLAVRKIVADERRRKGGTLA